MSITHIPFYPSDWLAGTLGMKADEVGVYITLIARMYEMAEPIERNDDRLYRICGCNSKRHFVKILNYLISEGKVSEGEGGIFNERVAKEINKVVEKSSKARAAAQERWDVKCNKINGDNNAGALRKQDKRICQPEPEPEPEPYGGGNARAENQDLTFRDKIIVAMGHDQSGLTATGRLIGTPTDMLELRRWQSLGLTESEILGVITETTANKQDGPAVSFKYFSEPMARFAGAKAQPGLVPVSPVGGRKYGNRTSRNQGEETLDIIQAAARARPPS